MTTAGDAGPDGIVPRPSGPATWADLLESAVGSMRDMRVELLELNARAAVLTEALDELVRRVIEEHAEEIVIDDVIRAINLDLRLERDPIDAGLLRERLPAEGARLRAERARLIAAGVNPDELEPLER